MRQADALVKQIEDEMRSAVFGGPGQPRGSWSVPRQARWGVRHVDSGTGNMDSESLHGPREDDELKKELRADLQAHRMTRAEEWRDPEAPGEDQPEPDETAGTPEGRARPAEEEAALDLRSDLARYLVRSAVPGDRAHVMGILEANNAPQRLLDLVSGLPGDVTWTTMRELYQALGLPVEHRDGG